MYYSDNSRANKMVCSKSVMISQCYLDIWLLACIAIANIRSQWVSQIVSGS